SRIWRAEPYLHFTASVERKRLRDLRTSSPPCERCLHLRSWPVTLCRDSPRSRRGAAAPSVFVLVAASMVIGKTDPRGKARTPPIGFFFRRGGAADGGEASELRDRCPGSVERGGLHPSGGRQGDARAEG